MTWSCATSTRFTKVRIISRLFSQLGSTNPALTDEQLQALWLRRGQTKPADFLRAKFAYQLSRRPQEKIQP